MPKIRTVSGDIPLDRLGITLSHEHVMCDFIGAEKVSTDRYDPREVFNVMLPYLREIFSLGVRGFVDCTPAFIGRDVELLARLADETGLNILTNTGLYKEPFLPGYAFELTADELMQKWVQEINVGIEGSPIKAGFIKMAVNPGKIIPIQQKIARAAARCSVNTGATIACHTGHGGAALELLGITTEEGMDPEKLIIVHSDAEPDVNAHIEIAKRGAWVEYDGIRQENAEREMDLIAMMAAKGFADRLLLSQDAGWYNVGEVLGGEIRGYAFLIRDFLPMMNERGFDRSLMNKLLIENPTQAFSLD